MLLVVDSQLQVANSQQLIFRATDFQNKFQH